jgi:hypothetical protein
MSGEFDTEPVPGLPEYLPAGERMLWQGAPNWLALAVSAFHVRKVAIYFAALGLFGVAVGMSEGASLAQATGSLAWLLVLGVAAISILLALAFLTARAALFTITDKRVVMRIGVALQVSINLPFELIESAAASVGSKGIGNIALTLKPEERVSYLILWPYARPWRLKQPEPMFRAIPNAERAAEILAAALDGRAVAAMESHEESAAHLPEGALAGAAE